ncbi:vasopressin V1b receptor [Microcaecilia unicolor]|uniref:Vasopressin V1b receptor n=1 Tax=Microcaecilia unicolor TaxID=1415580 RepID=A0A6P7ZTL1_9AMPH|nr:vasopressin V1b receptor [Microcaecilia unicolor]
MWRSVRNSTFQNSLEDTILTSRNQSSQNPSDPRDEELAKVEIAVLAIILAVTLVGNLGVLLVMYRLRKKMRRMHLFILHLGVTDLGVAVFQVLPQMIWDITFRFIGSDFLCRAVKYLQVLSMFTSTYMLVIMTVDRYIAVCHPLKTLQQPTKQAYIMIGGTWVVSCLLSIPQIFIFSLREINQDSGVIDCWADFRFPWGARAYITWTTFSIFIIPVGVLLVCYSLMFWEICRNLKGKTQELGAEKRIHGHQALPSRVSSVRNISRAKIRTAKMTFVIVLAYILCWFPFFCVQMWSVWDDDAPDEESSDIAFTITMLLASVSSCCNPWIYMFFNGPLLQDTLRHCFCCRTFHSSLKRENSNGSLTSSRNTILTQIQQRTVSGPERKTGSLKDFSSPYEDSVSDSGVL